MKKGILLLINGFGIERKDSIEIYSSALMPNLDNLTKTYVFGSLSSTVSDYNNGYRLFSIPQEKTKEIDDVDRAIEDKSINEIVGIKALAEELPNNKLHIFYVMEIGSKLFQVKEMFRLLNPLKDKRMFLHIILTSSNTSDYEAIDRALGKLAFEMGEYAKIGIIVGKEKFNEENITKTLLREYGEHWGEYAKKIETLKRDVVSPKDVDAFHVNSGFQLTKGDKVLVLNYKTVDYSTILALLQPNAITLYSLYEMPSSIGLFKKSVNNVECFIKSLEKAGSKVLLLTDKEKINDINYYLNGMQQGTSSNMIYAVRNIDILRSKESIINLTNNQYNGIIIDFNIGGLNKVDDIKNKLKEIDEIIKPLKDAALEANITFIISSLFGMHAGLMDGNNQKVVNFSGKVPCIIVNKEFDKSAYSIVDKDTYDLSLAFISCISNTPLGTGLLHKKSVLEKLLKK